MGKEFGKESGNQSNKEINTPDDHGNQTAALISQGITHHQEGELAQARRCYESALQLAPNNPQLIYLRGILASQLKEHQLAVDLLSQTVRHNPNDATLHDSLATALWEQGNQSAAQKRYRKALELNPSLVETWYNLGCVQLELKQNREAIESLLQAITLQPDFFRAYGKIANAHKACDELVLENYYVTLFKHFYPGELEEQQEEIHDLFFLDFQTALATAKKKNRFSQTTYVTAAQLCYYVGDPVEGTPKTLISLPLKNMAQFVHNTRLRLPKAVHFDPSQPSERESAFQIANLLEQLAVANKQLANHYYNQNRVRQPIFEPGKPLRIFLSASRQTVVMQYCSRYLAESFKRLGQEVCFLIEEDDREELSLLQQMKVYYDFNPHVIININHLSNQWLHPDVFNFTWWQDFMPELGAKKPLAWRKRDYALTADPVLNPHLQRVGSPTVYRQEFCIDPTLFKNRTPWQARKKAVFIGVSYIHRLTHVAGEAKAIQALKSKMLQGEPITMDFLKQVAKETELPLEQVYDLGPIFTHVVRETAVEWLCMLADDLDLDVEVYGRGWQHNPITAPFFKGELSHGEDVATVYNSAQYAVSASPYVVDSQRLTEIAACGAIPVMFDARPFAQKPHWDEECLWFHNQEQFNRCFTRRPKKDPAIIGKTNSYDAFAQRILNWVDGALSEDKKSHNS
ncbi:MAG: tetratricopeptide repeat protein [Magnetococcales bacterium]|nr:tetratricopeptide repeat protein [Magnetococcales bacterium]